MNDINVTMLGKFTEPAQYGMEQLVRTLEKVNLTKRVFLGSVSGSEEISGWVTEKKIDLTPVDEAFSILVEDDLIIIAGYDDVGLMYGCFALCEKLEQGSGLQSFSERPYLRTRGIYELAHNRDLEKERFYSKTYWTTYFDMLARNRINSFNYVFSHQTSYMAPVFAYFIRDEKYPQVRPDDIDDETIDKNDEMMAFISQQAEKRGISFILGIWQIYPWHSGQGDWRHNQINHVPGLTEDILEDYTYRGAKAMLMRYPSIKGIQVRVNEESSIPKEKQTRFFKNTIFKAVAETGRLMDYRGWLALPETTQAVIDMCPNLRASMKYWAEFLGAPYQPAKIEPGYSYGDLLVKPMPYRFMWQVWSLGSPRLLLWGDPQYVRRFVQTCNLGGSEGFEINPMLAQKGYGNEPGNWRIFKHKSDEYYTHEYERYWLFYLLMGRIAYNPELSDEVWMRELRIRFGEKAERILTAYMLSSRTITFLVQLSLSDPNMYIWPEIDMGGLLEFYLETPTSDKCVLQTIPEYVQGLIKNIPCGKQSPHQSAMQLLEYSDGILKALHAMEAAENEKELRASIVDFKVMAYLARYHAYKIEAGIKVEGYFHTGDGSTLYQAQDYLRQATMIWESIITLTENIYYDRMVTGPSDAGCWKAKRILVYEDELRLAELCALHQQYGLIYKGFDFGNLITMKGFENKSFELFERFSIERGFNGVSDDCVYNKETGFGFTKGHPHGTSMKKPRFTDRTCDWIYRRDALYDVDMNSMHGYRSPLTEDCVYGSEEASFECDIENGDYVVSMLFFDQGVQPVIHGPFSVEINGQSFVDNLTVMPLTRVERDARICVNNGKLRFNFLGEWFISAIIIRKISPSVAHMPIRHTQLNSSEKISATVTVPEGQVDRVALIMDGRTWPMQYKGAGHYQIDIRDLCNKAGNYTYHIRAESSDATVNSQPYTLCVGEPQQYKISHEPVQSCHVGDSVCLTIHVNGDDIKEILCHYSYTDQTQPLMTVCMQRSENCFTAFIPTQYITAKRDLLYYFEIIHESGEGEIYPNFRKQTPYFVIETMA